MNPALQAYFLYLSARGAQGMTKGLKYKFQREKETAKQQSEIRGQEAEKLSDDWNAYRVGDTGRGKINQTRAAAGTLLKGTSNFQRSMANNYMLAATPMLAARAVSGTVSMANNLGIHSQALNAVGSGAANVAGALSPVASAFRYAQYINPVYAATSMASRSIFGAVGQAVGNPLLGSMLAGPLAAMAMPMITNITSKIVKAISGPGISKAQARKLKPLSVDATLHSAAEFVNEQSINDANQLINQLYSVSDKKHPLDPIQVAQLQYIAEISAYTSAIPILTSEVINNLIKKDTAAAKAYNNKLENKEKYFKGVQYNKNAERRADREAHGKFSNTVTENLGMAAAEASSFLNKMSLLTDPIKQLQIVLSGGNIRDEIKKFDKSFQIREQQNAAIFAKTTGIGEEESYVNMYYSLNDDSQKVLSRAKTFEDAQIGLLSGVYEFTRLTALESATMRIKGYGIKEPIKYNVIGKNDSQEKGILNWLSNKIPGFELVRTLLGTGKNMLAHLTELGPKSGLLGALNRGVQTVVGAPRITRYHDERFNRLAEDFDIRRESTLGERIIEPFVKKINDTLLKTPLLKIFGNENRLSLAERKKLKQQEEKEETVKSIFKELGFEKMESQKMYYKYATTSMPQQYDLMIHHLANIGVFTHAIMINTAALAKVMAGVGHTEKPLSLKNRTINPYTGILETDEEHAEFQKYMLQAAVKKASENTRESKKSWAKGLDTLRYIFKKDVDKEKDSELVSKGIVQGLRSFYERERNTSEEKTGFLTSLMNRPMFDKEFLEQITDDEIRKQVLGSEIDKQAIIEGSQNYSKNKYNELNSNKLATLEAEMLKVNIAKITAPEFNKLLKCGCQSAACCEAKTPFAKDVKEFIDAEIINSETINRQQKLLPPPVKTDLLNAEDVIKKAQKIEAAEKSKHQEAGAEKVIATGWRTASINPGGKYTGMRGSATINDLFSFVSPVKNEDKEAEAKEPEAKTRDKEKKHIIFKLAHTFYDILTKDDAYNEFKNTLKSPFRKVGAEIKNAATNQFANYKWGIKQAKSGIGEALGATASGFKDAIYTEPKNAIIRGARYANSAFEAAAKDAYVLSDDNSISDVKNAAKRDKESYQEKLLKLFTSMAESLTTIKKESLFTKFKKLFDNKKAAGAGAAAGGLGLADLLSLFSKNGLKRAGGWLLKGVTRLGGFALDGLAAIGSGTTAAGASALAAGASLGYGAYNAMFGREKALIEKLDKAGVVDYNFFGDSTIKRWDVISKMPLSQLTQLLSFDDWDDETKKRLQQLVDAESKNKVASDKQMKLIFKGKKDFNKFVKNRDAEMRKKEGFWGYHLGKIATGLRHGADWLFTGFGLFGHGNSKDRALYEQLEDAGVIEYSTAPFVHSKVRDWDTIAKLSVDQLKSLLKLGWDDETEKRLKEIYNIRSKEKKHIAAVKLEHLEKDAVTNAAKLNKHDKNVKIDKKPAGIITTAKDKIANLFGSNDVVNAMIRQGAIDHHIWGDSEITAKGWKLIPKLSSKQVKDIIDFNDWDDKTKALLLKIYKNKLESRNNSHKPTDKINGEYSLAKKTLANNDNSQKTKIQTIVDSENVKNSSKPLSSKTSKEEIVESAKANTQESSPVLDRLDAVVGSIQQLIEATVNGHSAQIKTLSDVASKMDNEVLEHVKAPIFDDK